MARRPADRLRTFIRDSRPQLTKTPTAARVRQPAAGVTFRLPEYRAGLESVLGALPADRTVVSDLPLMPGRTTYQDVLAEVADAAGIVRADFAGAFNGPGHRLDIFSLLPPHLNNRGYGYWFDAFEPKILSIINATANRP